MSYSIPSGDARGHEIRVFRSAALSTGASGALVSIPWDGESSEPPKYGFTHSTTSNPERIVCTRRDRYLIVGGVLVTSGTWSEFRVVLEVDHGAGFITAFASTVGGGAVGVLDANTGPGTNPIKCACDLHEGDIVRVRCASVDQASVPLQVGQFSTWLDLRRIRT